MGAEEKEEITVVLEEDKKEEKNEGMTTVRVFGKSDFDKVEHID